MPPTHSIPGVIVSDNRTVFASDKFETFMKLNGITYVKSAPYHHSPMVLLKCATDTPRKFEEVLLLLMKLMMTRPQNVLFLSTLFVASSSFLKFQFHQQQQTLAAQFNFTSFQPCLSSSCLHIFILRVLWLRYTV